MVEDIRTRMEEIQKDPQEAEEKDEDLPEGRTPLVEVPDTSVPAEKIEEINAALLDWPEGFSPNENWRSSSRKIVATCRTSTGAHAETLAFGTLLEEGVPIRLTGQDSVRGTFSPASRRAIQFRDR